MAGLLTLRPCLLPSNARCHTFNLARAAGPESVAGLKVLPGRGWVTEVANVVIALLGLPSYALMMTIGILFAFWGPFPVVLA